MLKVLMSAGYGREALCCELREALSWSAKQEVRKAGVRACSSPRVAARFEYTGAEEKGQRNSSTSTDKRLPQGVVEGLSLILHNDWCNSNFLSPFATFVVSERPALRATIDSVP